MGQVYLATHEMLGIQRVIKVIHETHQGDNLARKRFEREAMALAHLEHRGVVRLVDFGKLENGWPWLCMEHVDGPSLDAYLQQVGTVSVRDACVVLHQVALALAHAHAEGIVHRDLKPANLVLPGGQLSRVKIIDFGLARMLSGEMLTKLTRKHEVMGSPDYMAPEQAEGLSDQSPAVDVYALAGIAYELLSGTPVFSEDHVLKLIFAHANEMPQRLSRRLSGISADLDDLLFRSLSKSPADRPDADELADFFGKGIASSLERNRDSKSKTRIGAPAPLSPAPLHNLLRRVGLQTDISDSIRNQAICVVLEIADHSLDLKERAQALRELDESIDAIGLDLALLDPGAADYRPLQDRHLERQSQRDELVEELSTEVYKRRSNSQQLAPILYSELESLLRRLQS